MMMADRDEIVDEKCLFCHTKPLDRTAKTRTGNAALKTDQMAMCKDCHPRHKDSMQQQHIGTKLTADMQAQMLARELVGLAAGVGPQLLEQAKKLGGKPTKMVGDRDGTITCSTCHNPHQYGVFPKDSVLSYRAMQKSREGKLVSPVRGQSWCKHCHDF